MLVVLQGMPLFFDKRLENHDVCVEPVLNFRFLLAKGLSCCSMGRVHDVTPVIIYIELLAVPKFRSRMSLNRDTFSGMAVAVVLMRNLAGCFARWNFFGHNWTFVQTRE